MTKRSSCQFRNFQAAVRRVGSEEERERERKKTVEDRRRFETENRNELRLLKKVGVFSKIFFPFRKEDLKFKTDEEELEEKNETFLLEGRRKFNLRNIHDN